jgi:UDP-N-acetylglucosamine 3-dehydrogenase
VKLNAGVIGVGNMGQHHARNYAETNLANLVAVADVDPKIGQPIATRLGCKYYPDYREMLEKEKLNVVTIAVPTKFHKKVALDCIAYGLHILIEKPIAANVAEAKEVVNHAKQKGIKFTVGHIERFNPAVIKLKEMVDKGKLGKITSIITRRIGPVPPQVPDANVVIDIGVHDIDLINWFYGGVPTQISAAGGNALNHFKQDYASFFLKYGDSSGMVLTNWITPVKMRRMAISGTKAYAELNFITQELDLYEINYTSETDDFGEFVIKFGEPKEKKQIKVDNVEPLKAEIESFIRAIKTNKRPVVTAREAIEALDIACKIDRMIRG